MGTLLICLVLAQADPPTPTVEELTEANAALKQSLAEVQEGLAREVAAGENAIKENKALREQVRVTTWKITGLKRKEVTGDCKECSHYKVTGIFEHRQFGNNNFKCTMPLFREIASCFIQHQSDGIFVITPKGVIGGTYTIDSNNKGTIGPLVRDLHKLLPQLRGK